MSVYRTYLALCATTFLGWGLAFFIDTDRWDTAPSFMSINEILPLWLWGTMCTVLGFAFLATFLTSKANTTKTPIMNFLAGAAASITWIWFADFMYVTLFGEATLSPMLPGAFFYIASVHMVVIQSPMREPELESIRDALTQDHSDLNED